MWLNDHVIPVSINPVFIEVEINVTWLGGKCLK